MVPAPSEPLVELRGITKRFGQLVANDRVDLTVARGEVHALLGENGAGKTTLMRILYGLTRPDSGEVLVGGRPAAIDSPRAAIAAGIGMVTQHFSLVRPMTVAENLALGRPGFRFSATAARRRVTDASERYGIRVDPAARVGDLSIGEQQRVEILKALARDCRLLILDEPTAVLVPQEVEALFSTLRRLVADGLGVVFISHKLGEVRSISDRVSVMRKGMLVGTAPGSTDERELARMMVGRPVFGVARSDGEGGTERRPALRVHRHGIQYPAKARKGRLSLKKRGLQFPFSIITLPIAAKMHDSGIFDLQTEHTVRVCSSLCKEMRRCHARIARAHIRLWIKKRRWQS